MKPAKVWLTRDMDGEYSIWKKEPLYLDEVMIWESDPDSIPDSIKSFCASEFKRYANLHKHLPKGPKGIKQVVIRVEEV